MPQRLAIRIEVGPAAPLQVFVDLTQSINTLCNVASEIDRQSVLNRVARQFPPLDERSRTELLEFVQERQYGPRDDHEDYGKRRQYRYSRLLEQLLVSGFTAGTLWPPAEVQAQIMLASQPDSEPLVPTVESLSYSNPFELILATWAPYIASGAGTGALGWLLNFACFVGPNRDKVKAEVEKTEAEAEKARAEANKSDAEAEEKRANAFRIRTETEFSADLKRALLRRVAEGDTTLTAQQIDAIVDDKAVAAVIELTKRPMEVEDKSDEEEQAS